MPRAEDKDRRTVIEDDPNIGRYRQSVKIIEAHRKVLADAGCSKELLAVYGEIVRHLNRATNRDINRILGGDRRSREPLTSSQTQYLKGLTQSDVKQMISDPHLSRKSLEDIAIHRFGVPKGSMRSFSNIDRLRQKLSTLIENEQSHDIIESIAARSTHLETRS